MLLKINSTCFVVDLKDCLNFKIINELCAKSTSNPHAAIAFHNENNIITYISVIFHDETILCKTFAPKLPQLILERVNKQAK